MNFSSLPLHPNLVAGIEALGYETPTPIQKESIPPVMEGHDLLGLAQTGTGKTAAFAIPIIQRLLEGKRGKARALIVAPTRELAEQINESFNSLGRQTRLRSVTLYGGVGKHPQIKRLHSGVEIIVACPGRLLDLMQGGAVNLSSVEVVVLDEADRMFDMGFLPDVRKILKKVPQTAQKLLFSATMPKELRHLVNEFLKKPVTIQVDRVAPADTVSHALYPIKQHLKTSLLLELVQNTETGSVLVFTRTKHRAKRIGEQLCKAGHKAASLQGNLSQSRRQAALDGFRSGTYRILVATDIAARGIDVSSISHVINYDMPDTVDAYTHRIGRTGRAAKTGDAFTLVTREDDVMVRSIERVLGAKVDRVTVEGFEYDRPAPKKNNEFVRGPRPSRGKPQQKAKSKPYSPRVAGSAKPSGGGAADKPTANPSDRPANKGAAKRYRPRRQG